MKHISEIIEDILVEWAYRVHDGMPNPKNAQHIQELRESMEELNLPNKVIYEVIQNLINEQDDDEEKVTFQHDGEKHTILKKTARQYASDIEQGKGSEYKTAAVKAANFDEKDTKPEKEDDGEELSSDKYDTEKYMTGKSDDKGLGDNNTVVMNDLVDGNINELIKSNNEVVAKRAKGISGMGGPVASHGEAVFTDATNKLPKYNEMYTEDEEVNQQNQYKEGFKNRKKPPFPKPNSEESEMFDTFGWDKNNPPEEAYDYFAKRELFADKKLAEAKNDPDHVFYKTGKKGFNGDEEAYKEWMRTGFDGAMATRDEIENNSNIDTSQPYVVIQAEDGEDTQNNAVKEALRKKYEETGDEHYKRQLDLMEKFNYHDTFAVGKNSDGKLTIYHISNKKASNLTDPHNNTTPAKRIQVMLESGFSKEISEKVGKTLKQGFDDVSDVKQSTVRKCKEVIISDDLASLADLLGPKYMKAIDDDSNFAKYREENNIKYKTTKDKLEAIQRYIQHKQASGEPVPYKFGQLFSKMGEVGAKKKTQQANPSINFQDKGILDSIKIKQEEKDMVKGTYKKIVDTIDDEDKELGFPDDEGNNGPNTQAYITTVMDSLHINSYIDNYDGDIGLTMGGRVAGPKDIRTCLAELSGFEGEIETPDGRTALKNHLKSKSKIDGEFGGVVTKSPNGEVKLFKDEWRSAGTSSQKVASYFGKDVQDCLKGKIDKRRKEKTSIGK